MAYVPNVKIRGKLHVIENEYIHRHCSINVYNLLTGTKNTFLYRVLFLFLLIFPVIVLTFIDYTNTDRDITKSILAERRALSILAANTIDETLIK